EACDDVDLVADHELLCEPLGHVGRDATDILADDLELLAADAIAVLLHVELDAGIDLVAGVGELARIRKNDADLHRVLRVGGAHSHHGRDKACCEQLHRLHDILPIIMVGKRMPEPPRKEKAPPGLLAAPLPTHSVSCTAQWAAVSPGRRSPARRPRCPCRLPGRSCARRSIRRTPCRPPPYTARTPAARRDPSAACPSSRDSAPGTPSCNSAYRARDAGRGRVARGVARGRICAGLPRPGCCGSSSRS